MSDWDDWEAHNDAMAAQAEDNRLADERHELAISQHLAEIEDDEKEAASG